MAARAPGHAVVGGGVAVFCLDSMAEVGAEHSGHVVVSGSHGGPSAARYALAARPLLSAFNDAGIGKDGAGISGLALLQANGLAALAVAHTSARIGEARSTLEDGVITHVNDAAAALGATIFLGGWSFFGLETKDWNPVPLWNGLSVFGTRIFGCNWSCLRSSSRAPRTV